MWLLTDGLLDFMALITILWARWSNQLSPLVFHLPKPYLLGLTVRRGGRLWEAVSQAVPKSGCVTWCFSSPWQNQSFHHRGSEVGQIPFAGGKSKQAVPAYLLSLGTITLKTVLSSVFNKKMKTAKHLKCNVLRMALTLPMHYCLFTVDAEVSFGYVLCSTFDSLLHFNGILHFRIIDKKILGMRPPSFKTNPHKREKRHEVPFLLELWSLLAWNLARKFNIVHSFTKIW